jgi:YVTN family beta-propeller protein
MKRTLLFCIAIGSAQVMYAQGNSGYHVTKTFHIASSGGWDYIAADPNSNRLYVSHGGQVNILDKKSGDSLGVILNTTGVHGIAFNQELGKGYTSNGRLNTVTVFDLKTGQVTGQVATGQNPDAIMYDEFSKKVITCNGRSNDLSVIDPTTNTVTTTIPVGGKPETAVSNNAGKIFVNIEDKNEIAVVDIATGQVTARWPLTADGPTGLAIDLKTHRLFAGCDKTLVVMNADNGTVVAKPTIGNGCDGVGFDSKRKLVFASCGQDAVVSVVKEESADKFISYDNVPTKRGARTIAVDEPTHMVYMPTAEFQQQAAGATGRPQMLPGTFQVVVVEK